MIYIFHWSKKQKKKCFMIIKKKKYQVHEKNDCWENLNNHITIIFHTLFKRWVTLKLSSTVVNMFFLFQASLSWFVLRWYNFWLIIHVIRDKSAKKIGLNIRLNLCLYQRLCSWWILLKRHKPKLNIFIQF